MKNKHLVLLFFLTLIIGLAVRRAPWKHYTFFQTNLLKLDTLAVQQIKVMLPGRSGIVFLRGDSGWTADQEERSVNLPTEFVQKMLGSLADLQSIKIVKTQRPDTLGFTPATAIELFIEDSNNKIEPLSIGWEILENGQAATYLQLPRHEGIYLVNKQLRSIFSKKLSDFRNQSVAKFEFSAVQRFIINYPDKDSLVFQKNDSTLNWEGGLGLQKMPNDLVQKWLMKLASLNNLPYADLFDESHTDESFRARIKIEFSTQKPPLTLHFFQLKRQNIPEDLPEHKPDRRQLSPCVVHSSENPNNYFALADTVLFRQICHPF